MEKFKCLVCEYVAIGDKPPKRCPICGADETNFKKIKQETKPVDKR
ncbi:MAG: rubredoxin [Deferribacterales bacterium]